jgi:hypothetical protein
MSNRGDRGNERSVGALAFDLQGLSGALQGEPPMRVAAYPDPIYASDLPDLVGRAERGELAVTDEHVFEQQIARAAFLLLSHPTTLPTTARALGRALAAGHLTIWAANPSTQALISDLGWA